MGMSSLIVLLVPLDDLDFVDSIRLQEGHGVVLELLLQLAGEIEPERHILGAYVNFQHRTRF